MKTIEILAPAGDMTSLQAALDAGADAVYLGLGAFNMRQLATRNFTPESLADASSRCRAKGVKLYVTLNSLIYEGELEIPFHVSTQMSCSNSASAKFFASQGATRIVLARECTLEEVKLIAETAPVEIETFVHGAICVAVSGRCLLSHHAYGYSASRGECHQPCRRRYLIKEISESFGLIVAQRNGTLTQEFNTSKYTFKIDEFHISNALVNLLDNANKYSPEAPEIKVRTRNEGNWYVVEISDKGMGMDMDNKTRIFEKFFREETGNIHNVKGQGLGLSYVKKIVELHKGQILVDSQKGKGSTFTIKLPMTHSSVKK